MTSTLTASDIPRLHTLQLRVEQVVSDGRWHTLSELSRRCGGTEASVSARLRDCRKRGWIVARKQKAPGLFFYAAKRADRPVPVQLELL